MITDLKETSFPALYSRFVGLFQGTKPWLKVIEKQQLQMKANPYSQIQIERENRVTYGLAAFDGGGQELAGSSYWPNVLHAMSFAAQVCEIIDKAPDGAGKKGYIGRIRGAFSNPADMRAIRFEHLTALALYRNGSQIEWPETSNGPERFDILATDRDGNTFEVECKSCSPDKGRAVTEHEATQFFPHILKKMEAVTKPSEVLIVKVRVPKRLPTSDKDLSTLAGEIVEAIKTGKTETEQGALLVFNRYSMPLANSLKPEVVQAMVNDQASREFNGVEGYRILQYSETTSTTLCVEVCSGRSPEFFDATWATSKHAIQNQMTGTRPGCLVLRLEGLDKEALEEFALETPNVLAWFATKVLRDDRHKHLACLAFISDETMAITSPDSKTHQSCSYVFNSKEAQHANATIGRQLLGL
ncbi:hypothetical protein ACTACG_02125 [Pseudomonas syringae]|uniref:hypothetical protein n=1 Tax=Pseudomonas syringae TaxID=317 RepID=UPI003F74DED9